MTRFIDKEGKILEISMIDGRTKCSFERDFFSVSTLEYSKNINAYMVEDVCDLFEAAEEYAAKEYAAEEDHYSIIDYNF